MRFSRVIPGLFIGLMLTLTACTPPAKPIPPMSQFSRPAIGTPIPPSLSAAPIDKLPPGSSGVAFYNQKGALVNVVLSDTVAVIAPTYGYLFVLAPGTYDFTIYESDNGPSVRTETIEPGKVRYVYIYPVVPEPVR